MPIVMHRTPYDDTGNESEKSDWTPRVVCDVCHQLIDDGQEGNAIWSTPVDVHGRDEPIEARLFFVHAGPCDRLKQELLSGQDTISLWERLSKFFVDLANASSPASRHPEGAPLVAVTPAHPLHGRGHGLPEIPRDAAPE